jgi:hypothetical protein
MQNDVDRSESLTAAADDAFLPPVTSFGEKSDADDESVDSTEDHQAAVRQAGRDRRLASDSEVSDRPNDGVAKIINMINSRKFVTDAVNKQQNFPNEKRQLSATVSDGAPLSRVRALVQNIESRNNSSNSAVKRVTPTSPDNHSVTDVLSGECPTIAARRMELMSSAQRRPIQRNRTILRSSGYAGMRTVAVRKDCLLKHAAGVVAPGENSTSEASSATSRRRAVERSNLASSSEASQPRRAGRSTASLSPSTIKCGLGSVLVNKFSVGSPPVLEREISNVSSITVNSDADEASAADFASLSNQLSHSLDTLVSTWKDHDGKLLKTASADFQVNLSGACTLHVNQVPAGRTATTAVIDPDCCSASDGMQVRSSADKKSFVDELYVGRRSQTLPLSACRQSIRIDMCYDEHLC